MLYLINNNYYMLRNREYVKVNVELKSGELSIKPDRNDTIEANDSINARGVLIEDVIKEMQKKPKSTSYERNKFDR